MRVGAIYRRRGIATQILRALIESASVLGMDRVYLHTLEEQHSAQSLYTHFGFTESGRGELHGNRVVAYEYNVDLASVHS